MPPMARSPPSFRLLQPLRLSVAIWPPRENAAKPLPVTRSHSDRSSTLSLPRRPSSATPASVMSRHCCASRCVRLCSLVTAARPTSVTCGQLLMLSVCSLLRPLMRCSAASLTWPQRLRCSDCRPVSRPTLDSSAASACALPCRSRCCRRVMRASISQLAGPKRPVKKLMDSTSSCRLAASGTRHVSLATALACTHGGGRCGRRLVGALRCFLCTARVSGRGC